MFKKKLSWTVGMFGSVLMLAAPATALARDGREDNQKAAHSYTSNLRVGDINRESDHWNANVPARSNFDRRVNDYDDYYRDGDRDRDDRYNRNHTRDWYRGNRGHDEYRDSRYDRENNHWISRDRDHDGDFDRH
jgi:hypothetical protein